MKTEGSGALAKIGIMGGSFDPIHYGHLAAAASAGQACGLDRVVFILNPRPPHKERADRREGEQRLHMLKLALADNPMFTVSTIEMERMGTVYTVDTLEELLRQDPESELYFILGADAALNLETWKQPERLLRLCQIIIVNRPDNPLDFSHMQPELIDLLERRSRRINIPGIGISSSAIRERIAVGESVRYMLPDPVWCYIEQHQLYRER